MIIRAAVESDLSWLLKIQLEAFSPPWTHGAVLSEIYNDDSFFALACGERGEFFGFVILRRFIDTGELLQIAVDKNVRRQGVAGRLFDAALGFAQENELKSIFLEVRKSNAAAISFYIKYGFLPIRQRKDYYLNPSEDAVEMVLHTDRGRYGNSGN